MKKALLLFIILFLCSFLYGNTPGKHTVALSWTDSGAGISSYNIYRGNTTGVCVGTPTPYVTGVTLTSFTDTTPLTGTNVYAVSAVGTGGESTCSSEVQVPVPNITTQAPTNMQGNVN